MSYELSVVREQSVAWCKLGTCWKTSWLYGLLISSDFFCPIRHWSVLCVHLEHITNSNLVLVHHSTAWTCVQLAGKIRGFASSALLLHTKTVTKPHSEKLASTMYSTRRFYKRKSAVQSLLRSAVRVWAELQFHGSVLGCCGPTVLCTNNCELSTARFTIKTIQVVNLAGVTLSMTGYTSDHEPPLNYVYFKLTNRWHYRSPFLLWLRNKSSANCCPDLSAAKFSNFFLMNISFKFLMSYNSALNLCTPTCAMKQIIRIHIHKFNL